LTIVFRHLHAAQKLPLDKYPQVKRWLSNVEQLESWKNTQAAVNKACLPNSVRTPVSVPTMVNYTKAVDQVTGLYFYEDDEAKDWHTPGDASVEITVSDGWPTAHDFTIDTSGFSVHDFQAKHSN
jgi:hypothetical protein